MLLDPVLRGSFYFVECWWLIPLSSVHIFPPHVYYAREFLKWEEKRKSFGPFPPIQHLFIKDLFSTWAIRPCKTLGVIMFLWKVCHLKPDLCRLVIITFSYCLGLNHFYPLPGLRKLMNHEFQNSVCWLGHECRHEPAQQLECQLVWRTPCGRAMLSKFPFMKKKLHLEVCYLYYIAELLCLVLCIACVCKTCKTLCRC